MFAVFTEAPQGTAELFMLKRQDWTGLYVVLLNPKYKEHVVRKNLMKLAVEEIFLPISDPSKYAPGCDLTTRNPLNSAVKAGPMPFKITTGRIEVHGLTPSVKTCGNPACDGRHLEGTWCAIPARGLTPFPIVGFSAVLRLPDFPELGAVKISSTSFAKLFCTDKFLNQPHRFVASYKPTKGIVEKALKFYEENSYLFELGGVMFGMRVEEGRFAVRKVVASYFKVVEFGRSGNPPKFDVA